MKPSITVVSVGPGDPDLLNLRTVQALKESKSLFLLTGRHGIAFWLSSQGIPFSTLDAFYESTEDFDELQRSISSYLWEQASSCPLVYAVPDVPTDLSVRSLFRCKPSGASVRVIPGTGYADVYVSLALGDLADSELRTLSAYDFLSKEADPDCPILITEIDNPLLAGQLKIRLSEMYDDEYDVVFFQGEQRPIRIPLFMLDRRNHYDHQSAVFIPSAPYLRRKHFVLRDLMSIMDTLRSPEGCPWDRVQTHRSLRPYLIEEAWECAAAIDQEDMDHLAEELGDLLFQIVFHASIGRTFEEFTINDIITSICLKMIRRHPHVFGKETVSGQDDLRLSWERIKREETGTHSLSESLGEVPVSLPSMKYASKVLKKICQIPSARRSPDQILHNLASVLSRLEQEPGRTEDVALEDLLLLCAELCYSLQADGELLLHNAVERLKKRLASAEESLKEDGKSIESLTFDKLGVYLSHVEGEIE